MITESFKSSKQCNIAAAKANRILGILQKTFSCRYGVVSPKMFRFPVGPHLEYCFHAWNPYPQTDIDTLEKASETGNKDGLRL